MNTAPLRREQSRKSSPKKRDPKAAAPASPHVLKATQRGFPPPYGFLEFAHWLFAFRTSLYREEWRKEHNSPDTQPQLPLKENPAYADLVAYNQGRQPVHGPDSAWGMRHFVEHQKKLASEKRPKKKPESGEKPPTDLERVWEYLKTEENRAYALLLLDDAVSEESQKRQRGKNTWGKTDRERKQKQSALKKTRATVEKQGTALIAALHAHLAETKAIAPLARLQFSFPHSSEAQKHVLAAECDNPGEIAFCIKDIQAAIERFRHLEDYDPAPKGPGQKGREKSKTGEVMGELDCLFRDLLPSKRQAQKFTQFLFYATGIEPDDDWGEWTGRIDRIRKRRMSSP